MQTCCIFLKLRFFVIRVCYRLCVRNCSIVCVVDEYSDISSSVQDFLLQLKILHFLFSVRFSHLRSTMKVVRFVFIGGESPRCR